MGRRRTPSIVIAAAFVAGAVCMLALVVAVLNNAGPPPALVRAGENRPPPPADRVETPRPASRPEAVPDDDAHDPAGTRPPAPASALHDLRARNLLIPVTGVTAASLHSSFAESRGSGRAHEAIDILAARNTPVRAVEDGVIAKLFLSKAGGTTIYQFDPTERYAYYYAHLDSYAPNLREGDTVKRGQTIGYVGTSGNAPPDTPHLHFAIFRLTDDKRWWDGEPVDPYAVWNW